MMNKVGESQREVEYSVFFSSSKDAEVGGHLAITDISTLEEIVEKAKKRGIDEMTLVKTEITREYYNI